MVDSTTDEYYRSRGIKVSSTMNNVDYKKTPSTRPASRMRINGDAEVRSAYLFNPSHSTCVYLRGIVVLHQFTCRPKNLQLSLLSLTFFLLCQFHMYAT